MREEGMKADAPLNLQAFYQRTGIGIHDDLVFDRQIEEVPSPSFASLPLPGDASA